MNLALVCAVECEELGRNAWSMHATDLKPEIGHRILGSDLGSSSRVAIAHQGMVDASSSCVERTLFLFLNGRGPSRLQIEYSCAGKRRRGGSRMGKACWWFDSRRSDWTLLVCNNNDCAC